jgi:ADP-heptose:LPS heptosyltransferase
MHIAAAVKTPTVALFALTNPPEQWGPWHVPHHLLNHDVPCRLCYNRACPYEHDCLRQVTPETVVTAASDLLGATDTAEPARHPVLPLTAHPFEPAPTVTP